MVAVAQLIPQDPDQKESVLAVLREHPELQDFIVRASEKAEDIFPDVRITLDTVRYDEWDQPVTMTISVVQPMAQFQVGYDSYVRWLVSDADFQPDLIMVMPVWRSRLDERS